VAAGDPSAPLQAALHAAINAGVPELAGRVRDRVSADAKFPYVSFGEIQATPDGADCVDGFEVFVTLHVWSRDGNGRVRGSVHVRELISALRAALHEAELAVAGWRAVLVEVSDARSFQDPDGLTTHGVVTVRALLDPAG
jgi:hypothetical protein